MKKFLILLLVLTVSMVMLFTGCEDKAVDDTASGDTVSEDTGDSASADTGDSEDTADDEEGFLGQIKIGVSIPITGNYAEHGKGLLASANLALEDINSSGGIMGYELVLDIQDSASDPTVSADIAKKFVEDEEICMVMGDFASGNTLAMAPICQEGGLPELTPSSSSADIPIIGDYIFAMVGSQPDEQAFNAKYLFGEYLECETIAIIYVNNDWGAAILAGLTDGCEAAGIEIISTEAVAEGDKDFSAILTKVEQAGPDGIFLATQINESANIVNQMAQSGYSENVKVVISGGSFSDQLLELIGNNGDGMYTTQPYFISATDTRGQEYSERFMEECGLAPNIMTIDMYDGLMMVKEAIERAGSFERDAIKDSLAMTKDYDGITGMITFDENGMVHRDYMIIGIEDGAWVALTQLGHFSE